MNIQIVNVFPVRSPYTENPSTYTYPILLLDNMGGYYYWGRGVSIPISEYDYAQLQLYPKIFEFSKALKYHYLAEIELIKRSQHLYGPLALQQYQKLLSEFPAN
jgi:hypothetical protein